MCFGQIQLKDHFIVRTKNSSLDERGCKDVMKDTDRGERNWDQMTLHSSRRKNVLSMLQSFLALYVIFHSE